MTTSRRVRYPRKEDADGREMRVAREGGLPGLAVHTVPGWK